MRSISQREVDLLQKGRFTQHFKLEIENAEGNFIDLTDLEDTNWVRRIEIENDIDNPVKTFTFDIKRNLHKMSFSPLMKDSKFNELNNEYSPAIDLSRQFKIHTAIVELGTDKENVSSEYWREWETGIIDRILPAEETMQLQGRDLGGLLEDDYIRTERKYGSEDTEIDVETILQDILNDNGYSNIDLKVPVSPGWAILPYRQEKESILDAHKTLVEQIGWDIRYKYYNPTNSLEYVFYEPERNPEEISWVFNHGDYININNLDLDIAEIRNVVRVVYSDINVTDDDGEPGKRMTIEEENQESIDKYGERFMEISEASNSQINTASEAQKLVDSGLHDLSWPKAQQEIETHFFFPVQLHDYYEFEPNGVHYDRVQKFGVVSYRHSIDLEEHEKRTFIETTGHPNMSETGKPVGLSMSWFKKEARPGIAKENKFFPPSQPQNVNARPALKGASISYDINPESDLDGYKVYCSDTSGFTINRDKVVARGRSIQWNINSYYDETSNSIETMQTGQTYYMKVRAYDGNGNLSETSIEVSAEASVADADDIGDGAIGTDSIQDLAVNESKLADSAVTNEKIGDGEVDKDKTDGWSGTFIVDDDGTPKTVTVENGLITNVE